MFNRVYQSEKGLSCNVLYLYNPQQNLYLLRKLAIFKGIYIVTNASVFSCVPSVHRLHINLDVSVLL